MKSFLLAMLLLTFSSPGWSAVEFRQFNDPQQEQQYQELINELRCLVCQNQTIADSNADLAKDLRRQVYEMLQQGNSQQEIIDFMTRRYGDFVLYNPSLKPKTLILWWGPALFIVIGLIVLWIVSRRKMTKSEAALTESEQKRIRQLLEQEEDQ